MQHKSVRSVISVKKLDLVLSISDSNVIYICICNTSVTLFPELP